MEFPFPFWDDLRCEPYWGRDDLCPKSGMRTRDVRKDSKMGRVALCSWEVDEEREIEKYQGR